MQKYLLILVAIFSSFSASAKTVDFKADLYLERCVDAACTSPIEGARTNYKVDLDDQGNGTLTLTASSDGVDFTAAIDVHNSTDEYYDFQINEWSVSQSGGVMQSPAEFSVNSAENIPYMNVNVLPITLGNVTLGVVISLGPTD